MKIINTEKTNNEIFNNEIFIIETDEKLYILDHYLFRGNKKEREKIQNYVNKYGGCFCIEDSFSYFEKELKEFENVIDSKIKA